MFQNRYGGGVLEPSPQATLQTAPQITVAEVGGARDRKAFVELPYRLYRDLPAWQPPLRLERRMQVSPRFNALLSHIDARMWLARQGGRVVGRIASFQNRLHDETHGPGTGFFGYLDCEPDPAVGQALLRAALDDLRARGCREVVGPMQWSVNEEVGLLVDGFEHPNVMLTPFGRADYAAMLEREGFEKAVDLYAFTAELDAAKRAPPLVRRLIRMAQREPRLHFRAINKADFKGDVLKALSIYNDAWADNWFAVPYTPKQAAGLASELRPLMFEGSFQFVELDGEPMAFGVVLPDLNQALEGADGHLTPLSAWRAVRRLKRAVPVSRARLPLMGMKREHHNSPLGVAAVTQLCENLFAAAEKRGFETLELSWVLEDNVSLIRITEQAQAERYKTYRMYRRDL